MKKNTILILVLLLLSATLYAVDSATYISPNNDGVQDSLRIPFSISDTRYIVAWEFVVVDSTGTAVRTIGNKEKRPEQLTIKSFFQQLIKPKQGIDVPSEIMWNGVLDSGEVAPDGIYQYYVTATDDNGNMGKTPLYTVVVDNTAPELSVQKPSGVSLIFSPDADGNKDSFSVQQSGSSEDKWEGAFKDASGNSIKTYNWTNTSPANITWDGKNDNGVTTIDGVYSYEVTATDRAGNYAHDRINNIIVDTIRPSINVTINTNFFSPSTDSKIGTVRLMPSMPVTNGLTSWEVNVLNADKSVVRSYSGTSAPQHITFDGKDSSGAVLPEGNYQAEFKARYVNGHQPRSLSPLFTLDVTPPSVQLRLSSNIFSPDGDGRLDMLPIYQTASAELEWKGSIKNAEGDVVRTYIFANQPSASISWDGLTDTNSLAPDGSYTYELTSTDRAGNIGLAKSNAFELNTGTTELILTANKAAFSPVVADENAVLFTPTVKTRSNVVEYVFTISTPSGRVVKTTTGSSLPNSFTWNGLDNENVRVEDGLYVAKLETVSENGNEAAVSSNTFTLDSQPPTVEVSVPYLVFSPNNSGKKDVLPIYLTSSKEELWTAQIIDEKGTVVRAYNWNGNAQSFDWNGTDESGNPVPDGEYSLVVESTDNAGNATRSRIADIVVDVRIPKAFLTASEDAFSANGDGFKDVQKFNIMTSIPEGITAWNVEIVNLETEEVIRSWSEKDSESVPAVINWDGLDSNGRAAEGLFYANLFIEYLKGDEVSVTTPTFVSSTTPPVLTVKTAPQYFSPDNDGLDDDAFISLAAQSLVPFTSWTFEVSDPQNGESFWKVGGASTITERIIWDGRSNKAELVQSATDYPYTFTVTDSLGMTSVVKGIIAVDVLVIKIGDVLKIQVPSIIFRENAADFNTLAPDVVAKNNFVLGRIASILNKFRDYSVIVEGHANNISGTEQEEVTELVPLSQARAEAIKQMLGDLGVNENRLTTIGIGGRQPVAAREDRTNWWKNRRVEFILNK